MALRGVVDRSFDEAGVKSYLSKDKLIEVASAVADKLEGAVTVFVVPVVGKDGRVRYTAEFSCFEKEYEMMFPAHQGFRVFR